MVLGDVVRTAETEGEASRVSRVRVPFQRARVHEFSMVYERLGKEARSNPSKWCRLLLDEGEGEVERESQVLGADGEGAGADGEGAGADGEDVGVDVEGARADVDSDSFDGDFVPSLGRSSSNTSFDLGAECTASDMYFDGDDNEIEDEDISYHRHNMPLTVNRNPHQRADEGNRCMGYSVNVDSEYEDSANLREMADDSEGEVDSAVRFNQRVDIHDPKFVVGMVFESFDVLKHAIRTYSIKRRYPITINKNDKVRVRAVCGDNCLWTLYATPYKVGRGGVQIRTLVDEHTCVRGFTNKFATTRWVVEAYYDVIRMNPETKTGQLVNYIQRDYNILVKRHKVGRARRLALDLLRGDEKEQYAKLADYAMELRRTNQNSTLILSLDNLVFKKLFVCLTPCKLGFLAGCRPIISLDGCFLKGLYGGQILAAVAIDPNDCIWPVAYAIVDVECRESWKWFIELLGGELGIENSHSWTFMSDRKKVTLYWIDLFPI